MATKKPKASAKPAKAKTTKPAAVKAVKTTAKTAVKPASEAPKTKTVEETKEAKKGSCLKGFFAKKYEEKEGILTVFKRPKFYGALLGEIFGTAFMVLLLFSLFMTGVAYSQGAASIVTCAIAVIAIYVAVHALSGACLNPIVTVGMMASRRMSVIRGVMYIIAEVVGAWLAWLIFNSFHMAGGESSYEVPTLAQIGEGKFWVYAMIELLGAVIIAFFYARALRYKRSAFTFAAVVAGGFALAFVAGFILSVFAGISNNFILNPAAALMFKIFPESGENFGVILGGICQALSVYALLPMVGGVVGFYLSDFMGKLSEEE
ncbi:aquaporin [Candidatus Saccharibacteria bacterium]|nr:aquaporin [Candidatus Saccharibacteria bacterium]